MNYVYIYLFLVIYSAGYWQGFLDTEADKKHKQRKNIDEIAMIIYSTLLGVIWPIIIIKWILVRVGMNR